MVRQDVPISQQAAFERGVALSPGLLRDLRVHDGEDDGEEEEEEQEGAGPHHFLSFKASCGVVLLSPLCTPGMQHAPVHAYHGKKTRMQS
jgi:hypothetical protein